MPRKPAPRGNYGGTMSADNPFSPGAQTAPPSRFQRTPTPASPASSRTQEPEFSPEKYRPNPLFGKTAEQSERTTSQAASEHQDYETGPGRTGNELGGDKRLEEIVTGMRNKIKLRGARNIAGLGKHFRIVDDSGDGRINAREFEKAMREYGFNLTSKDIDVLLEAYDRDGDGYISYDEFLLMVRGSMNQRRKDLVNMAYDVIDVNSDGTVTLEDVAAVYDASKHPEVISGEMTAQEVFREFMSQWDTIKADGIVSRDEFIEYYQNVSASIDEDDYFELMIRNAWHIAGGEGWCENTSNLRVLVKFKDGTQKVIGLKNDLGLDKTDVGAISKRLQKQGVDVSRIETIETSSAVARKPPLNMMSDRDRAFPTRGIVPTGIHANLPTDPHPLQAGGVQTEGIRSSQAGYALPGYTGHRPGTQFRTALQYGL